MNVRKVEYRDGNVLLEATVASQTSEKRPVILVFHAWDGKNSFAEEKAKELAELGYTGVALDLYGKGVLGKTKEEKQSLMSPFMADRTLLQKRILAYKSLLSAIPEADESKVGAIGYCFGGLCALDLIRSVEDVKVAVSFHGLFDPPFDQNTFPIRGKILTMHGSQDPMVSWKQVESFSKEMEGRDADFQMHVFGKAMHAFTNPEANDPSFGTLYHGPSDRRSWSLMKALFSEVFSLD